MMVDRAWLTAKEAAAYLGFSVPTLYGYRYKARGPKGPRSYKVGGQLRYRITDLDAWLERDERAGDLDDDE
jgi:predicted DNA-binding transcriptional regulator AlpA